MPSPDVTAWTARQLAMLRPMYPAWEIWVVPRYCQTTVWCARPVGHPVATINTDSPEHLIEGIRCQEQDAL